MQDNHQDLHVIHGGLDGFQKKSRIPLWALNQDWYMKRHGLNKKAVPGLSAKHLLQDDTVQ